MVWPIGELILIGGDSWREVTSPSHLLNQCLLIMMTMSHPFVYFVPLTSYSVTRSLEDTCPLFNSLPLFPISISFIKTIPSGGSNSFHIKGGYTFATPPYHIQGLQVSKSVPLHGMSSHLQLSLLHPLPPPWIMFNPPPDLLYIIVCPNDHPNQSTSIHCIHLINEK